MIHRVQWLEKTKKSLDAIGPGMCLAKWMQVTLHLHNGHTHSCHHPNTHKIPVEGLKEDPSRLHNTDYKKEQRKTMLSGGRPAECQYCWNVEDNSPKDVFSDRVIKSSQPWASASDALEAGYTKNIDPSYLEVSFSKTCNFKCSYCSPQLSSRWSDEVKEYGGYPTSLNYNNLNQFVEQDKISILEREDNPYVDAFWQWWPSLYPNLHTFRITGGEPLMSKHTFKVLDYIIEHPNHNLELAINSNCVVEEKLFDKFIEKVQQILDNGCVKMFTLYTSCEAYDLKADYIRFGLDYNQWIKNCSEYLEKVPNGNFSIMSTYNALSVTSYKDFLKDVLTLKSKYITKTRSVIIDTSYVNYPAWLNVGILPLEYKQYVREQIDYMIDNQKFFQNKEIDKLKRIEYLFKENPDKVNQKDFYLFFKEHDTRRNTNFLDTFPEMKNFYSYCQNEVDTQLI